MNGQLKTYEKYYLKKDYNSGRVTVDDKGEPVLGELIRTCRLQEQHVKVLNKGWQESGIYYALQKPKKEEPKKEVEKVEEVKEVKATAQPKEEAPSLDELRKEAKELGVKNTHVMKEEKLIEKINEAKK
jgi:hypothetical protein